MNTACIVKDGRSPYHIVNSYFADECERFASSELQKYIYQATDVLIPYFSDICEKRSVEIIVGKDARNARDYVSEDELSNLGDEGFIIRIADDGTTIICGNKSRGTLYGVYAFLERFLNFRCLTSKIERIDHVSELIIKTDDIIEKPDFEYRDAYFRDAFDGGFASKNRLNTSIADISREKGSNMKFYSAHHTFETLFPSKIYFKDYPEYYSEIDGERMPTQPCLSNENVIKIITENIIKQIKENPHCKVFSVAQNDNQKYCRCEKCRALDERENSPAGSMITFVNRVAEEVEKVAPDVLIHTFAYQFTRHAPLHVRPRHNVIVRLCNIECEFSEPFEVLANKTKPNRASDFLKDLSDWTSIHDRVYIWDYAVNFHNYLLPFPNFYQMAENIKLYKKMGVKGVLEQGNFSYGGGAAMDGLKAYLISKLLWDVNSDPDKVIDTFLADVYGKGAPYLKEYILKITKAVKGHVMDIRTYPDSECFSDEAIIEYDRLFNLAINSEDNEEIRERIEREYLSIEYLKTSRIEDDNERAKAVDTFANKVIKFKLTEIMERRNLYDSFEYMKRKQYSRDRTGNYLLYYVVK